MPDDIFMVEVIPDLEIPPVVPAEKNVGANFDRGGQVVERFEQFKFLRREDRLGVRASWPSKESTPSR